MSSYSTSEYYNLSYSDSCHLFYMSIAIQNIRTKKQLANYLRCDEAFLERAISEDYKVIDEVDSEKGLRDIIVNVGINGLAVQKMYIKKRGKNNGYRIVYAVRDFNLSNTLKILNKYLTELYVPPACVHGFVKGKSVATNAHCHLAKKHVLSVDIKDYFNSVSKEEVAMSFESIGYYKDVAIWLSELTTLNGYLAQGFNTSPTIANIVSVRMDKRLLDICGENIIYTRYADDLYFSGNSTLPEINQIATILKDYNFELNPKKTLLMKRGQKQYVTGLTVFDPKYPRISKKIKKNIRLETYYLEKYGYEEHAIRRLQNQIGTFDIDYFQYEIQEEMKSIKLRLYGWIHFIGSIEPKIGRKYYNALNNIEGFNYSDLNIYHNFE